MASSAKKTTPITKELSTFLSWNKDGVIGHKEETINGRVIVTKIWCKLCAKYKEQIMKDPSHKGAVVKSLKAFTDGTDVVTKHQVLTFSHIKKI